VVVGLATLTPSDGLDASGDLLCVLCGPRGLADALANVLLLLPLGLALGSAVPVVRAALWAGALALAVELAQLALPGRHPTLGDVLFGALGGGLGAWLGAGGLDRILRWAAAPALAALVAPMLVLAPAPQGGTYYGQWTTRFWNLEPYEGQVTSAHVGAVAMPVGPSERSDELRRLLADRAPLEVEFVVGPDPAGLAPLFSVYDHLQREVLFLGVDGRDLVFRERLRAAALRLDQPVLVFPDALAGLEPGDRARARIAWDSRSPCMTIDGMTLDRRIRCDLAPGFAAGWTLLLFPPPGGRRWSGPIDLVWAGALALPFGWLLGRPRASLAAAALLAVTLLALAHLAPDTRATPWAAASLIGGALLGAVLRRRAHA
jgi:hypothetical protein